jgi:hypothetical protein
VTGHRLAAFGLFAALAAPAVLAFRDGPPVRVTGGFGEDNCSVCHAGQPLDEPAGRLTLGGLPARLTPGTTYALTLELARPGLKAAGFQLAIRDVDDGTQAGRLEAAGTARDRVAVIDSRGVQFAQQTAPEIQPGMADAVRWPLTWTAPARPGRIAVDAAAVAGDGDDSELGDHVYTFEIRAGT